MKPMRLFKGPLFSHRDAKRPQSLNAADPVGHGNIDEEDFSTRSGRPTRKDLELQRKSKEDHRGE